MSGGGRRVLVTGGTRGIGRAVAEALVARGDRVAVVGRDPEALEELAAAGMVPLAADLSDPAAVDGLLDRAVAALGGVDDLVQSAGLVRYAFVGAITRADVEQQLAVNLVAPMLLDQAFAAHAEARGGGGAIVHVTSTLGQRSAPGTAAYAASKAGLVSLTRTMALELAPLGVRVNAVAPGVVETDMVRVPRLQPGEPEPVGAEREARVAAELAALQGLHPLGRLGTAEDVAETVLHALDAAWMTGAVLTIDGGLTAG